MLSMRSTTTVEPMPDACVDSTFDFLVLTIDQEGPFDIGATCTVQDAYPSINVELLELSCPTGDATLLSNGVGFEGYFEPGQTVELIIPALPRHTSVSSHEVTAAYASTPPKSPTVPPNALRLTFERELHARPGGSRSRYP